MRKVMSVSLEKGERKNAPPNFLRLQEKSSKVSSQREIEFDAPSSIYLFVRGLRRRLFINEQHSHTQIKPSLHVATRNLATELIWEICEVARKVSLILGNKARFECENIASERQTSKKPKNKQIEHLICKT